MADGKEVKTGELTALDFREHMRLDSKYFLSEGFAARRTLRAAAARGIELVRLGGDSGLGTIWMPNRLKHYLAMNGEPSVPYLRPFDIFEFLPIPADYLSASRTAKLESYRVRPGLILLTRSGRNLGPAVMVDAFLARFMQSDDLLRLDIRNKVHRFYALAFLRSSLGQSLIRTDKSGSVIDHIGVEHASQLELPVLTEHPVASVAKNMEAAHVMREKARLKIDGALRQWEGALPAITRSSPLKNGWGITSRDLTARLDAAFYDPLVASVRKGLLERGGLPVSALATVLKPAGRYKTYYVGPDFGVPILSGRQIHQAFPVNLQFMAPRVFADPDKYRVRPGWTIYQADGRAEENLGLPTLVTSDRDGWLASGHVGRVIPKKGIDAGCLFLALRSEHSQLQLKAMSSGSVVDSTFPWDMESVVLPPLPDKRLGQVVRAAWAELARAKELEDRAVELFETTVEATLA